MLEFCPVFLHSAWVDSFSLKLAHLEAQYVHTFTWKFPDYGIVYFKVGMSTETIALRTSVANVVTFEGPEEELATEDSQKVRLPIASVT
jgi:hypothetical protein